MHIESCQPSHSRAETTLSMCTKVDTQYNITRQEGLTIVNCWYICFWVTDSLFMSLQQFDLGPAYVELYSSSK